MNDKFTGFSKCIHVAEFEKELRIKRTIRRNTVKLSTEAILDPAKFSKYINEIRSKLNFQRTMPLE